MRHKSICAKKNSLPMLHKKPTKQTPDRCRNTPFAVISLPSKQHNSEKHAGNANRRTQQRQPARRQSHAQTTKQSRAHSQAAKPKCKPPASAQKPLK